MNQIARCERARWSHLARSGLPAVSRMKNFHQSHIINPLLTKFARSRWLDIGLVLFFASLWTSTSSRSINTQEKNLANIQPSWPHTWSITHTYVDPTTINLVLSGWNWSLLTVSQSPRFFTSELILLASTLISELEVQIWVSSAYKQGVVNFKQFGRSFRWIRKRSGPRIEPLGTPQSKLLWEDKKFHE